MYLGPLIELLLVLVVSELQLVLLVVLLAFLLLLLILLQTEIAGVLGIADCFFPADISNAFVSPDKRGDTVLGISDSELIFLFLPHKNPEIFIF